MRTLLLCVVCSLALASAAPALANSPTQGAYQGPGSNQLSQVQDKPTNSSASVASGNTLPFTGLSIPMLAVIAVVMVGTGLVLRSKSGPADR